MLFNDLFQRFVAASPISVMAHGVLERALSADRLDAMFEKTAQRQYTKTLLFSTTVDLMSLVVCRVRPSMHAAYQAKKAEVGVSVRALYDKLQCLEPEISEALVKHTAARLEPLIRRMKGAAPPLVAGYRTKILDGNHLGKSDRRLEELRDVAAGPLPGQTLVVLEPELGLATGVICCEDGHAQERKLLKRIWPMVEENDLWIADRNFCTTDFLFGLSVRQGFFLIRQHGSTLTWTKEGREIRKPSAPNGEVFERKLWLQDAAGNELVVRQVTLKLKTPTREGETTIRLVTNLPAKVLAAKVAALYRERWTIEQLFQRLTQLLRCEMQTLGYPKAALFGFCVALAASNALATVKAALRATHKNVDLDDELSDFCLADELSATHRGMMIALPEKQWAPLAKMTDAKFAAWLIEIAKQTPMAQYKKYARGPKKERPRRTRFRKKRHVSTAKLLADRAKRR